MYFHFYFIFYFYLYHILIPFDSLQIWLNQQNREYNIFFSDSAEDLSDFIWCHRLIGETVGGWEGG